MANNLACVLWGRLPRLAKSASDTSQHRTFATARLQLAKADTAFQGATVDQSPERCLAIRGTGPLMSLASIKFQTSEAKLIGD
jgi:hypothetical protein